MAMKSFEELTDDATGTGGVGSLIPADVYADMVLEGVVCYGQLSGVVTALEYDQTAGCGAIVQVPYVTPRTHSCASGHACATGSSEGCLSATSTTFGTYPIQINKWGDYDLLCNYALWEANCFPIMKLIMNEMSKRMAHCRDAEIWNQLVTSVASANVVCFDNSTVSCGNSQIIGSCCTFTYDLYNSLVSVIACMRAKCYEPDYIILNPSVAKVLYMKDGAGYFNTPLVTFDGGHLGEIMGCKVIETGVANSCSNIGNEVMAVVLDSKRAVGEAWGMKPKFTTSYVPECDNTKLVLWQYWGAAHMDFDAIGYVRNPALTPP